MNIFIQLINFNKSHSEEDPSLLNNLEHPNKHEMSLNIKYFYEKKALHLPHLQLPNDVSWCFWKTESWKILGAIDLP